MTARYREGTFHRQRLCEWPGCDEDHKAAGYCIGHYQEARRQGLLEVPECSIPGCPKPVSARGWCRMHHARWLRTGDALKVRKSGRQRTADRSRKRDKTYKAPPINEPWVERARCTTHPEWFDSCRQLVKARQICAMCPVRSECLKFALDHDVYEGIRGGFTPAERRVIAKVSA